MAGSAEDWDEFRWSWFLFQRVRAFVATRCQRLLKIEFNPLCREILAYRKSQSGDFKGLRAFMHVGHHPSVVCAWLPAVRTLSISHQIGLYLHEFGHLGSNAGDDQADAWVKRKFGIAICYTGPLGLEAVTRADAEKVLARR